jgi:hypothetical protein
MDIAPVPLEVGVHARKRTRHQLSLVLKENMAALNQNNAPESNLQRQVFWNPWSNAKGDRIPDTIIVVL